MNVSKPISLADPEILRCPFQAYKTLQNEHPVYLDPLTGMYVVTRYEDIRAIANNPALFSNDTRQLGNRETEATPIMLRMYQEDGYMPVNTLSTNDPPGHTQQRALVDYAFRVSRIRIIEPYIEAIANELVDKLVEKNAVEFVSEIAIPMPIFIIADQLGVPRDRMADFKRWSDSLVGAANVLASTETQIAMTANIIEMQRYLAVRVTHHREHPADNVISDVANAEIEGKPLEMPVIISMLIQLLAAGNETTTSAIGMGMELLIRENLESTLREQPKKIVNFVEEVLRLQSPIQGLFRRALADTEFKGVQIPQGSIVMLRWAAGNRDPEKYERPDEVVLDRRAPNQHLTFGLGIHFCVGNALARAELRAIFQVLLQRLKNFRLDGEPELIVHGFARALSRLPIAYDRV